MSTFTTCANCHESFYSSRREKFCCLACANGQSQKPKPQSFFTIPHYEDDPKAAQPEPYFVGVRGSFYSHLWRSPLGCGGFTNLD